MILCIDAGNTRIKWGRWATGGWQAVGHLATAEADQLVTVIAAVPVDWIGISCVAGDVVRARIVQAIGAPAAPVHWLQPVAVGHGVTNCYTRPASLGSDRYAAMIGALRQGYAPCVVVSAGTAVTVDALSGRGEFLGGMILPGATLMRRALGQGTAGVAELAGSRQAFPRSTGDAVESGIWAALAGVVEGMAARLAACAGGDVATLLSGGDAAKLAACLPAGGTVIDGLVLEGLVWVARDLDAPGV